MPDSIVLLREYAMQYRDGLITANEMAGKIAHHLNDVRETWPTANLETGENIKHEFTDELAYQLLLNR